MNKIETSIINGLNGVTNKKCEWKLFSSRYVNSTMELKTDKEKKLYTAIEKYLFDRDTSITVLPIKSFITMFVKWDNGKLIENVSTLVTVKDIEKCLKYYYLKNHLTLNRYFCLTVNSSSDNTVFITSVCRESGIYSIKEKNDTTENDTTENKDTMDKIADMINNINLLCRGMSIDDKKQVVSMLEKSLNLKVNKVKKSVKSA